MNADDLCRKGAYRMDANDLAGTVWRYRSLFTEGNDAQDFLVVGCVDLTTPCLVSVDGFGLFAYDIERDFVQVTP